MNTSGRKIKDVSFSADYRNSQTFTRQTPGGMFGGSVYYDTKASDNNQYQKALSGILKHLKSKPIPEGEQLNLAGYSYGAVLQAHLAIGLVENGYTVDNLILVGSPTSDNSSLMETLNGLVDQGKIGNIIRYDLSGDYLSNPKDQSEFLKGGIYTGIKGDDAPHFDLARPGEKADSRIKNAGEKLVQYGVE